MRACSAVFYCNSCCFVCIDRNVNISCGFKAVCGLILGEIIRFGRKSADHKRSVCSYTVKTLCIIGCRAGICVMTVAVFRWSQIMSCSVRIKMWDLEQNTVILFCRAVDLLSVWGQQLFVYLQISCWSCKLKVCLNRVFSLSVRYLSLGSIASIFYSQKYRSTFLDLACVLCFGLSQRKRLIFNILSSCFGCGNLKLWTAFCKGHSADRWQLELWKSAVHTDRCFPAAGGFVVFECISCIS